MLKSLSTVDLSRKQTNIKQPQYQVETDLPPQKSLLHRISKHPKMMHYNRLIALVALINLAFLLLGLTQGLWTTISGIPLRTLSNLVLVNIALAILIRQQYVINMLFKIATSAPTSWPLSIRWLLGKVYHFGGLHVGGAVVGTIWFAILVVSMTSRYFNGLPGVTLNTIIVT